MRISPSFQLFPLLSAFFLSFTNAQDCVTTTKCATALTLSGVGTNHPTGGGICLFNNVCTPITPSISSLFGNDLLDSTLKSAKLIDASACTTHKFSDCSDTPSGLIVSSNLALPPALGSLSGNKQCQQTGILNAQICGITIGNLVGRQEGSITSFIKCVGSLPDILTNPCLVSSNTRCTNGQIAILGVSTVLSTGDLGRTDVCAAPNDCKLINLNVLSGLIGPVVPLLAQCTFYAAEDMQCSGRTLASLGRDASTNSLASGQTQDILGLLRASSGVRVRCQGAIIPDPGVIGGGFDAESQIPGSDPSIGLPNLPLAIPNTSLSVAEPPKSNDLPALQTAIPNVSLDVLEPTLSLITETVVPIPMSDTVSGTPGNPVPSPPLSEVIPGLNFASNDQGVTSEASLPGNSESATASFEPTFTNRLPTEAATILVKSPGVDIAGSITIPSFATPQSTGEPRNPGVEFPSLSVSLPQVSGESQLPGVEVTPTIISPPQLSLNIAPHTESLPSLIATVSLSDGVSISGISEVPLLVSTLSTGLPGLKTGGSVVGSVEAFLTGLPQATGVNDLPSLPSVPGLMDGGVTNDPQASGTLPVVGGLSVSGSASASIDLALPTDSLDVGSKIGDQEAATGLTSPSIPSDAINLSNLSPSIVQAAPLPSCSAVSCLQLATFFEHYRLLGRKYPICGELNQCYNLPTNLQKVVSSLEFEVATGCTLYGQADCGGQGIQVPSAALPDSNTLEQFQDSTISFSCYQGSPGLGVKLCDPGSASPNIGSASSVIDTLSTSLVDSIPTPGLQLPDTVFDVDPTRGATVSIDRTPTQQPSVPVTDIDLDPKTGGGTLLMDIVPTLEPPFPDAGTAVKLSTDLMSITEIKPTSEPLLPNAGIDLNPSIEVTISGDVSVPDLTAISLSLDVSTKIPGVDVLPSLSTADARIPLVALNSEDVAATFTGSIEMTLLNGLEVFPTGEARLPLPSVQNEISQITGIDSQPTGDARIPFTAILTDDIKVTAGLNAIEALPTGEFSSVPNFEPTDDDMMVITLSGGVVATFGNPGIVLTALPSTAPTFNPFNPGFDGAGITLTGGLRIPDASIIATPSPNDPAATDADFPFETTLIDNQIFPTGETNFPGTTDEFPDASGGFRRPATINQVPSQTGSFTLEAAEITFLPTGDFRFPAAIDQVPSQSSDVGTPPSTDMGTNQFGDIGFPDTTDSTSLADTTNDPGRQSLDFTLSGSQEFSNLYIGQPPFSTSTSADGSFNISDLPNNDGQRRPDSRVSPSLVYVAHTHTITSCLLTMGGCRVGLVTTTEIPNLRSLVPVIEDQRQNSEISEVATPSSIPEEALAMGNFYSAPTNDLEETTSSPEIPSQPSPPIKELETRLPGFSDFREGLISFLSVPSPRPFLPGIGDHRRRPGFTTSTVYSTRIHTITSCHPTKTTCHHGDIVTETISLYTTVCPLTDIPTLAISLLELEPTGTYPSFRRVVPTATDDTRQPFSVDPSILIEPLLPTASHVSSYSGPTGNSAFIGDSLAAGPTSQDTSSSRATTTDEAAATTHVNHDNVDAKSTGSAERVFSFSALMAASFIGALFIV